MGGGQSTGYMKDTVKLELYRRESAVEHEVVGLAFNKCINKDFLGAKTVRLTAEEQQCVNEYTRLYAQYAKSTNKIYNHHYELYERDMQNKAQQEAMAAARGGR